MGNSTGRAALASRTTFFKLPVETGPQMTRTKRAPGDPARLAARAKGLALALGFDRAGVAPADPPAHATQFRDWLARGYAGEMTYLERRMEERLDPALVVADARSILCVASVYAERDAGRKGELRSGVPADRARVARYALGADYHDVMRRRLLALGDALEALAGRPLRWRAYVDTGPVLEREAAASAGLGWVGKNTCLIDPELGSYFFLGVLISDLELARDTPVLDHCGTCRACLDVCPTEALRAPRLLDATRCLAYTTIELRSAIPEPLRAPQENWVFGCDLCQEVCPWNSRRGGSSRPPSPLRAQFAPREAWRTPTLRWLLGLDETAWRDVTRKSALRRAKHRGLIRNALVAAGNSGDPSLRPEVEALAASEDALIAEHARWALQRLPPD